MLCPRSSTIANWMASLHAPSSWTWSTDRVTRQLARAPVHIGLLKCHWNLNKWIKLCLPLRTPLRDRALCSWKVNWLSSWEKGCETSQGGTPESPQQLLFCECWSLTAGLWCRFTGNAGLEPELTAWVSGGEAFAPCSAQALLQTNAKQIPKEHQFEGENY